MIETKAASHVIWKSTNFLLQASTQLNPQCCFVANQSCLDVDAHMWFTDKEWCLRQHQKMEQLKYTLSVMRTHHEINKL